jgi:hypothetical protein
MIVVEIIQAGSIETRVKYNNKYYTVYTGDLNNAFFRDAKLYSYVHSTYLRDESDTV